MLDEKHDKHREKARSQDDLRVKNPGGSFSPSSRLRGRQQLLPVDQEKKDSCHIVKANDLDQNGDPGAETGCEEPRAPASVNVVKDGKNSKGREEQVVPGCVARKIVGHAPHDDEQGYERGNHRRHHAHCDRIDRGNEQQERQEQGPAQRQEPHAKKTKRENVQVGQTTGVSLLIVSVRHLPGEHPLRALRKGALVGWNPTSIEKPGGVNAAQNPHDEQNQESPSAGRRPGRPTSVAGGARDLFFVLVNQAAVTILPRAKPPVRKTESPPV